MSNIGKQSAD